MDKHVQEVRIEQFSPRLKAIYSSIAYFSEQYWDQSLHWKLCLKVRFLALFKNPILCLFPKQNNFLQRKYWFFDPLLKKFHNWKPFSLIDFNKSHKFQWKQDQNYLGPPGNPPFGLLQFRSIFSVADMSYTTKCSKSDYYLALKTDRKLNWQMKLCTPKITFNLNLLCYLCSYYTHWTIYSATTFLEKCRKVVWEIWFEKSGSRNLVWEKWLTRKKGGFIL